MDTALTALVLLIAFAGLGIVAYVLVLVLDRTRTLDAGHCATHPSRFFQVMMMYGIVLFATFAALAFRDGEKWPVLVFLSFVAVAAIALFPALLRKQYWTEQHLVIDWPFLPPIEIRWDDVVAAKATNFPERIVFDLTDGSRAAYWTEQHFGVRRLAEKLHEKLGDRFRVGVMSNLREWDQEIRQRSD